MVEILNSLELSHKAAAFVRTRSKILAWSLLAGVFIYYGCYIAKVAGKSYGYNPTGFMCVGPLGRTPGIAGPDLFIRDDQGYDSQIYYFMALDPWITNREAYSHTVDAYRYQRFLYPLLAWTVSFGSRAVIPYAMILINLAATLGGTILLMFFCDHFQANRLISLFFSVSSAAYLCLMRTTAEPLYLFLLIAGFFYYIVRDDLLKSAILISLAVWTKEVALASAAGIFLFEILSRRRSKKALYFLLPLCAYLLLQSYVYVRFDDFSISPKRVPAVALSERMYPLQGLVDEFADDLKIAGWSVRRSIEPVILMNIFFAIGLILINLANVRKYEHPFHILGMLYIALTHVSAAAAPDMIDIWGYGRHTAEIFLCCMFIYFYQKQKIFLAPLLIQSVAAFTFMDRGLYQ